MLKIRKIIGRDLDRIVNGYMRVQVEMDLILSKRKDVSIKYDSYEPPGNILDHFWKRLIKYPRHLRKTDKSDIINHIIVQNLSDLARKLDLNRTIIHLLDIYNFISRKGIKNNWLMNRRRLKGLKKCKHIIAISEFSKNEAVEKLGLNPDNITVIKCGVNRKIFRMLNPEDDMLKIFPNVTKILHVGTESGRKEFLTLLYAFKEYKKYDKTALLIRVGKAEFTDEIVKSGLENDILYFENIKNYMLNVLYNVSDLFVFPSSYEGFALPIIEALSTGTPVICSNIPIFWEIYGKNVTYFDLNDHISLEANIRLMLKKDEIRYNMIKKGLKFAEENKWEKYANQYLKYMKKIEK